MAKFVNKGNQMTNTGFRNGGRVAGIGTAYDDYSEESGNHYHETYRPLVRFPHDNIDPKKLNGEVIIVQEGKAKDNG